MKKGILFIVLSVLVHTVTVKAQGKYQISGKISGMQDDLLMFVQNDGERMDTLATTTSKNGVFVLTGELKAPVGGYLTTAKGAFMLPLIVESTNVMVNITPSGALIQGGKQQELFAAYNRIAQEYAAEQVAIQEESMRPGADMDALQKRVDNAYRASVNKTEGLIKANPDAYATAYVIALGAFNETEEGLRAKYNLLGDNAKNSVPGKQIASILERFASLTIGQVAPNFTANRPNGESISLYNVPAKIKLLVFWESENVACRQANPDFIRLYQQFRPKGFEIISFSLDTNRFAWDRAIEQDGLIWSNVSDLQGRNSSVAKAYMVGTTLPYTVLVDSEHKIVAKGLLGKDLRNAISTLVKESKRK
ncbi:MULTISPECIES: redoxin domain-containing protein [Butyricimonas]|uniref:redoxin domain-containing protein n=1 Tax=Butyricimonas TaxID=574697 RepID=UPI0007FB5A42|nr:MULTISPECIES: redoxin domain-containing protein [Butyricimonas]